MQGDENGGGQFLRPGVPGEPEGAVGLFDAGPRDAAHFEVLCQQFPPVREGRAEEAPEPRLVRDREERRGPAGKGKEGRIDLGRRGEGAGGDAEFDARLETVLEQDGQGRGRRSSRPRRGRRGP
jgi:hypothetical protein